MPRLRVHIKFDKLLKEKGIISEEANGRSVHTRIDKDTNYFGPNKSVADPDKTIKLIRGWISSWAHFGRKGTKTDCVRIALGHMVVDDIRSRKEYTSESDLLTRALISYKKKGFHKTFYREK
ncbi:MAG TPA: hypothetical protein VMZ29_16460 [Candidatus Bathyarchaeia archaeon]|nr:hypothetical protein [Candidatus Bathyarchaeia archaeon]